MVCQIQENQNSVWITETQNRSTTEKSAKSHVEVSDVDERREIVTRQRNLPRYLSDYTFVPGQNKLQTIKNRRKSMRANLTRKMNIIKEYLEERKDRKLIELAYYYVLNSTEHGIN